jgi:hypothetical protein
MKHDHRYYDAIAEGVYRAMWEMITNATDAPCADFYATIERAAEAACERMADARIQREANDV